MDEIVVRKNLNITAIKTYIVAANNISGETISVLIFMWLFKVRSSEVVYTKLILEEILLFTNILFPS